MKSKHTITTAKEKKIQTTKKQNYKTLVMHSNSYSNRKLSSNHVKEEDY